MLVVFFQPSIDPPGAIDLSTDKEENFRHFVSRWKTFSVLTELDKRDQQYQTALLKYCVGVDCVKVVESDIGYDDSKSVKDILDILEQYCIGERNIIHERFVFNTISQAKHESFDTFYAKLRAQAKRCGFQTMTEDLIRDRIVLGIEDDATRKKLIAYGNALNVDIAVRMCRSQEVANRAMKDLGLGAATKAVDAVAKHTSMQTSKKCNWCGNYAHPREKCPAKDADCRKCLKKGHFAKVCRSAQRNNLTSDNKSVNDVQTHAVENINQPKIFTGEICIEQIQQSEGWTAQVLVNSNQAKFKLDSGADATIIKANEPWLDKIELMPCNARLVGPSNYPIKCLGSFVAKLRYGDRVCTDTAYVIENQSVCLLSRHACKELNLLQCNVNELTAHNNTCFHRAFPSLFRGLGVLEGYAYEITLKPDATPMCLYTARTVPHPLRGKVKEKLKEMVSLGVISPVKQSTDWCSGMVVVPKTDGSVRVCVDLTHLNESVQREVHPMASVDESLAKLGQSKIFTRLDANSGFWQLPLTPSSRLLTTFLTPEGRFCFNRLPFGISSAPEVYQRCMSEILSGLDGVICHMDDILIHGQTQDEHDNRVRAVLERIQKAGLTLNEAKCCFNQTSVKFLGHIVDADGIRPDPDKISAIVNYPQPRDKTEIRRFNGMLNQLSKFVPNLATITAPIRLLLREQHQWNWGLPQIEAFSRIKQILTSKHVLAHYDPTLTTIVATDASQYGLGAALFQVQKDGSRKPVCFASRALTDVESRYAVIEKEALAVAWGCERFEEYIYGLKFTAEIDHKPLVPLLTSTSLDNMPSRILRFRLRLMKYSPTVVYVPGSNHHIADALSRTPNGKSEGTLLIDFINEVETFVDNFMPTHDHLHHIRQAQKTDPLCTKVIEFCREGWPVYKSDHTSLTPFWEHRGHLTVANDVLLYDDRLVIPAGLQLKMLELIHDGHLGIVKCRARAKRDIWWPGMSNDIAHMVNNCLTCQKELPTPTESLAPSSLPERPWEKLGMDLFDLNGQTYLLVVDYFSRWIDVMDITRDKSSQATVNALKVLFSTHGYPDLIISDNGPQFASAVFTDFAQQSNFLHITSSPRYPKANGESERAVGTIKRLFRKTKDLQMALLNYRSTPLSNGYSPAELLMNRRLKTLIPTIQSHLRPTVPDYEAVNRKHSDLNQKTKNHHDHRHRAKDLPDLEIGDPVYVRDQKTEGHVVNKVAPRSYTVRTDTNTSVRRNRSALIDTKNSTIHKDTNNENTQPPTDSEMTPVVSITRPIRNRRPPPYLADYDCD